MWDFPGHDTWYRPGVAPLPRAWLLWPHAALLLGDFPASDSILMSEYEQMMPTK